MDQQPEEPKTDEQQPAPAPAQEAAETEAAAQASAAPEAMPEEAAEEPAPEPDAVELKWQASEYVHHQKGPGWYLGLAGIVVGLLLIAFIFHLWLSMGVFVVMGAAIAVYARRPPRVMSYELTHTSLIIEDKHYPYSNFRSFGVISDENWHTIDLEPRQRFMPRLSVLFGDEDFEAIVGHLAQHLPRADRKPDFVERLSGYLRF
ncbi:MAG TPA: hypothetical protein VLF67_03780 [Candidatus Saccharimonas sp.]|nr:hypothetical protein [Candidatus Saccharimonas sp.]